MNFSYLRKLEGGYLVKHSVIIPDADMRKNNTMYYKFFIRYEDRSFIECISGDKYKNRKLEVKYLERGSYIINTFILF